MTNDPDFRELVGDEGAPGELDRLRRVHELIVAAGPPPELSPAVEHAPKVREESKVLEFKRRRPAAVFAIAAAIAAVAFAVGYGVGHRSNSFAAGKPIDMHGVGVQKAATASISVGKHDSGGNYPLQMSVTGLKDLPKGGWYELLLSKKGHPTASCGDFIVDGGQTTIRLSVPYDLPDWHQKKLYDGWVVVRHLPGRKNAAPIVMTTA